MWGRSFFQPWVRDEDITLNHGSIIAVPEVEMNSFMFLWNDVTWTLERIKNWIFCVTLVLGISEPWNCWGESEVAAAMVGDSVWPWVPGEDPAVWESSKPPPLPLPLLQPVIVLSSRSYILSFHAFSPLSFESKVLKALTCPNQALFILFLCFVFPNSIYKI